MELSDSEEEIIDLNAENDKSKEEEKKDKPKYTSKNSKWIKPSVESLSQMAKSEPDDTDNGDQNNIDQNYANFEMDNDDENAEENQDKLSDYNNYDINKDNDNNDYKDNNKSTEDTNTYTNSNSAKNNQNYTFTWDEGGNNVKLIGSFSNWVKYYDMEKDENDQIFKFSLPLENGKYQYKFIVDGVWKYSKKQNTEDDGKGNINNILDIAYIKPKEEIKKKNLSKKNSKIENKKKIKEKKKKEKKDKKSDINIKKEKKKILKKKEFGNDYPDPMKLTEPNHDDDIGKAFNINNESKQKKIGIQKYNKFEISNSYSSNKSYLNISCHIHTKLNHIIFQKKIKNKYNSKLGMSYRYRGKATTFIYYNCLSNQKNI